MKSFAKLIAYNLANNGLTEMKQGQLNSELQMTSKNFKCKYFGNCYSDHSENKFWFGTGTMSKRYFSIDNI